MTTQNSPAWLFLARPCAKTALVICDAASVEYPCSAHFTLHRRIDQGTDSAKTDCAKVHLSLNDILPACNGRG